MKETDHYSRFSRYFCDKIRDKYICYEVDDGLYVSDDNKVLYAKDLDKLSDYFLCDYEKKINEKLLPCTWEHEDSGETIMNIKKLNNIDLPEYKRVNVVGRKKPVPVIKLGSVIVDKEKFNRALRVFLGDEVKIYYPKKSKIAPVVIEDLKTGEAIFIPPYV